MPVFHFLNSPWVFKLLMWIRAMPRYTQAATPAVLLPVFVDPGYT